MNDEDGVAFFEVRPISAAYLIPKNDAGAIVQLDAIIRHAHETWGGRFYPIILTDGTSLSDADWNLLNAADPDIITSSIPLEKELLQELDRKLTPLSIELPRDQGTTRSAFEAGRSGYEGFPIFPSALNVRSVLGIPAIARQPSLVKFDIDTDADPVCRNFIDRNFGQFSAIWAAESALNENQVESHTIKDLASLTAALSKLSRWDPLMYPVHFCSHPWKWFRSNEGHRRDVFTVVVGDQLTDLACFWNRVFLNDFGDRSKLKQLWLPTRLAEDASFCRVLSKWLSIVSHSFTNSHDEILITSTSMTSAELGGLEARLRDGSYLRTSQEQTLPMPMFEKTYAFINRPRDMRPTPMPVGKQSHFNISAPEVFSKNLSNGHWMVDCFIEHRSRMHDGVRGSTLWWQLPQRRQLAREIFARPARIRREGIPSVLMDSNSHCPWDSPETISITSPSPGKLFSALCCGERQPQYLRSKEQPSEHIGPYRGLAISDKGGYLRGVVELLGGLYSASRTFESRLWRRILFNLGRSNPDADTSLREQVERIWLETKTQVVDEAERLNAISQRLAGLVRSAAKEMSSKARSMTFKGILQEASREMKDYNTLAKTYGGPIFQNNPKAVQRSLSELTEQNVIRIGYELSCDHCFFKNWKHIDETRQSVICDGCGKSFSFPPETRMSYRLNHLVHLAVNHQGVVPVLLVLGDLFRRSRSSFVYIPSLDLFEESSGGPSSELDIVCIQDGQFIIGEVKTSSDSFRQSDFDKMRNVAAKLRPEVVLFSALDGKNTQNISEMMNALQAALTGQNTKVIWHELMSNIHEPDPER